MKEPICLGVYVGYDYAIQDREALFGQIIIYPKLSSLVLCRIKIYDMLLNKKSLTIHFFSSRTIYFV